MYNKKYYQKNKEKIREKSKAYYLKNRETQLQYFKDYRKKQLLNPEYREKESQRGKKYRQNNKEKVRETQRRTWQKSKGHWAKVKHDEIIGLRNRIYLILGNCCAKCGFSDIRALQIDHINGGGTKERKKFRTNKILYQYILSLPPEEARAKYQILCANCNWIKRFENDELRRDDGEITVMWG